MNRIETNRASVKTPTQWTLQDWEGFSPSIASAVDLETAIRNLAKTGTTPNRIVDLESPSGAKLSVGIASAQDGDNPGVKEPLACVQVTAASLDPPYVTVIGDPELDFEKGGVVVFRYDGSWTEILRRNCVPVDVMVRIAHHFYANGNLPDWIGWEEV
jgi:Immunity protein Imm1